MILFFFSFLVQRQCFQNFPDAYGDTLLVGFVLSLLGSYDSFPVWALFSSLQARYMIVFLFFFSSFFFFSTKRIDFSSRELLSFFSF